MRLYHGTLVPGLKILSVSSRDRERNPALYLTDNRAYGLFYIRDREIDFVTCGVGKDGKVYYDEKFPSQLEVLYRGKRGFLYETDAQAEQARVPGIWLCRKEATITGVEEISDVYEAIKREIERGTVVLLRYEELTLEQKAQNHAGIVNEIRRFPVTPQKEAFYRKYFPEAWDEARKKP